nr:hypothetical protein [Nitrosopumilaceae archaeon]NIP09858.1 hypothetical protein [Nitrosopumilaceae archaeon]NIS94629.1 hypothetical protein [Nitrosopumilaceae archaeon]
MKQYTILIIIIVAAAAGIAAVFGFDVAKLSVPTQDYDIFVDPLIDQQNLFEVGRVTIQNTGSK